MKSRMSFSFKVAMLSAATAAYLGTTVIFAQSGTDDGSMGMQLAQAKPGLFHRLFSRDKQRETAPPQQPATQNVQYQQNVRSGKSKVQQLLEARYRAEGREIPPLTLDELEAQQQGQQPEQAQTQQYQQPQQYSPPQYPPPQYQQAQQQSQQPQRSYQQPQRMYQQPSRSQQGYAAGASALPGNSYGSSAQTFGGPQTYAAGNTPSYQKPAAEQPKRRRGFRGFLSRLNPFRRKHREEPTQPATPAYNNQPVRQPRQQYAQQHPINAKPMPTQSRYATQPNYGGQVQPPAEPPRFQEPRPFPGVPSTVADAPSADSPFAETVNDSPFAEPSKLAADEDLPTLAGAESEAVTETVEPESSPFDDEPLPELVAEEIPADNKFEETTEAEFEPPVVVENDSTSPFSGKALESEEEVTEEVDEVDLDSDKQIADTEENLPKLEPVPPRNEYLDLDKLNKLASSTDRAALRREKRRLLLLSRPDQKGLKGFCPVTLKDERDLVDAKPEFESEYDSKIYRFSSAGAKLAFDRSPEEYAPAKGGVDVVKYSLGAGEIEGTLEFAAWFRGKLYLFSSAVTYDAFMRSPAKFVDNQKKAAEIDEAANTEKSVDETEADAETEVETEVEPEADTEIDFEATEE